VSENILFEVSAHSAIPTGVFVEVGGRIWRPIGVRSGVYGNHLFSVIAAEGPNRWQARGYGGFLRVARRAVLVSSPYAYQKASWLVPAVCYAVISPFEPKAGSATKAITIQAQRRVMPQCGVEPRAFPAWVGKGTNIDHDPTSGVAGSRTAGRPNRDSAAAWEPDWR
jgi:hypothetical protein